MDFSRLGLCRDDNGAMRHTRRPRFIFHFLETRVEESVRLQPTDQTSRNAACPSKKRPKLPQPGAAALSLIWTDSHTTLNPTRECLNQWGTVSALAVRPSRERENGYQHVARKKPIVASKEAGESNGNLASAGVTRSTPNCTHSTISS